MTEKIISIEPPKMPANWRELVIEELDKWKPRGCDPDFEIALGDDLSELRVWRGSIISGSGRSKPAYTVVWGMYLGRPLVSCDEQDCSAHEAFTKLAERMKTMKLALVEPCPKCGGDGWRWYSEQSTTRVVCECQK